MRSFLGFGQTPYIGQPYAQAIKLAGIAAQAIPLLFQWISYGASTAVHNLNVLVDLNSKVCAPVDQIRSVYIDNLGCDQPVYVYFPDTNYTVVAKPNSEGWYPAMTNSRIVWVVCEGFLTGDIGQTFVILSNVSFVPSVNVELDQSAQLWRASPVITRGTSIYNSALGIPALGDQVFVSGFMATQTLPNSRPLWGTPYASGFIYVRTLQVLAQGIVGAPTVGQVEITSTGAAGILFDLTYNALAAAPVGNLVLLDLKDMQLKLDATQTWQLKNIIAITDGGVFVASAFTQSP